MKLIKPPPSEWIVTLSTGETYLWNDFECEYIRYVLGHGIFHEIEDWHEDENSEYYIQLIKRINEVQANPELINETIELPERTKVKRGRGYRKRREMDNRICEGCGCRFNSKNPRQKYHNIACKQRHYRLRKTFDEAERLKKELNLAGV